LIKIPNLYSSRGSCVALIPGGEDEILLSDPASFHVIGDRAPLEEARLGDKRVLPIEAKNNLRPVRIVDSYPESDVLANENNWGFVPADHRR
jgi:hypothetical protein